jgi:hypothetical protein
MILYQNTQIFVHWFGGLLGCLFVLWLLILHFVIYRYFKRHLAGIDPLLWVVAVA